VTSNRVQGTGDRVHGFISNGSKRFDIASPSPSAYAGGTCGVCKLQGLICLWDTYPNITIPLTFGNESLNPELCTLNSCSLPCKLS